MILRASLLCLPLSLACGSAEPSPVAPSETSGPSADEVPPARSGLSAKACEEQGGKVVGDIGDGAIHRPDYKCTGSGEPPLGAIVPDPGGPVAIEGAVCCK